MTRNRKFGIGACLLVAAIGYLMYAGVQQSSTYYFTVEEFAGKKDDLAGQGVRVAGRVTQGSVQKKTSAKGTEMHFSIGEFTDQPDASMKPVLVAYTGIVPDMFAEGRDVIVEGRYVDGVLQAKAVMTSCPSKYEPGAKGGEQRASN